MDYSNREIRTVIVKDVCRQGTGVGAADIKVTVIVSFHTEDKSDYASGPAITLEFALPAVGQLPLPEIEQRALAAAHAILSRSAAWPLETFQAAWQGQLETDAELANSLRPDS